MMALAESLPDVIRLEAGEPSFRTPEHITEAAFNAARAGHTRYTHSAGIRSLREAIAERHAPSFVRSISAEDVFVGAGAVNALVATLLALVDDGDEVLLPDPGWPNYRAMVQLTGGVAVPYVLHRELAFEPDLDELERAFSSRTKAILLNSPANPTGAVLSAATLRRIVDLAAQFDAYVVSDEVYEALVFDGARHVSAGSMDPDGRAIVISGCSKTYAMTGWRIGWAVADPSLVSLMTKLQEPLTACASAVSQVAAEAALRGPQDSVTQMRDAYQRRRDLVCDMLQPHGLLVTRPQGAFYVMADLSELGVPSAQLALALLEEEHVSAAPGSTFGQTTEGMLRLSLATSEDLLVEACQRLIRFMEHRRSSAKGAQEELVAVR